MFVSYRLENEDKTIKMEETVDGFVEISVREGFAEKSVILEYEDFRDFVNTSRRLLALIKKYQ